MRTYTRQPDMRSGVEIIRDGIYRLGYTWLDSIGGTELARVMLGRGKKRAHFAAKGQSRAANVENFRQLQRRPRQFRRCQSSGVA